MRREKPSNEWLIGQLAGLGEARQAAVSPTTFDLFGTHLSQYDQRDITAAIRHLSLRRRSEGETAFPDLATMDEAVRDERNKRMAAERKEREREQEAAERRDREEHPDKYVEFDFKRDLPAMLRDIQARKGQEIAAARETIRTTGRCPTCGAVPGEVIPQSLTPKQLRELADSLERQEGANAN
jgi:hypothetical protein